MIIRDYVRAYPGGTPVSGVTVTLKKHIDNSTVTTAVSDANGMFEMLLNGSPGPCYWEFTTNGTTRRRSSKTIEQFGTFDTNGFSAILNGMGTGMIPNQGMSMAVAIGGGTRQVTLDTGACAVKGVLVSAESLQTLTGTSNATGSTRIDTVVWEVVLPGQTEEGKATAKIVAGTTVAPTLTQTSALWQFPIRDISLVNGGTAYTLSTDRRTNLFSQVAARGSSVTSSTSITSTTPTTITGLTGSRQTAGGLTTSVTLTAGVVYTVIVFAHLNITTTGGSVYLQPIVTGYTADNEGYACTGSVLGMGSTTEPNVIGTGASVSVSLKVWKDSAATATYSTGGLTVMAIPQ